MLNIAQGITAKLLADSPLAFQAESETRWITGHRARVGCKTLARTVLQWTPVGAAIHTPAQRSEGQDRTERRVSSGTE